MGVFKKVGQEPSKALIPGVNFLTLCELVGRPKWHVIWLLVPLVNIFFFCYLMVETTRSFGRLDFQHTALAVAFAPAEMYLVGKGVDRYVEPNWKAEKEYKDSITAAYKSGDKNTARKLERQSKYKKAPWREWFESLFFAVFAAALIRMFLIEAYTIPTPSMEGSLLVGDYLFVSKAHYGLRTPSTILQVPLLHNRLPFGASESYLKSPNIPSVKFPALESLDKMDPVVFNWPAGDSVYITPRRSYAVSQITNLQGQIGDRALLNEIKKGNVITRPVDKRDHYIKRCIATPGDTLLIANRQVYVNGEKQTPPEHVQYKTMVWYENAFNFKFLEDLGIDLNQDLVEQADNQKYFTIHLSPSEREKVEPLNGVTTKIINYYDAPALSQETMDTLKSSGLKIGQYRVQNNGRSLLALDDAQYNALRRIGSNIKEHNRGSKDYFPNDPKITQSWNADNFGPIYVPKAGATVDLTTANLPFYNRIINVYENHDLEVKGGAIYIDGEEVNSYTFEQNYYWMMGDNRHASEDSRMWGYVPEDHIVGKPLFIFMSAPGGNPFSGGVRWDRIFTSANRK